MEETRGNKILVLLGSPRKNGNSAVLASRIARGAQSEGAEVETIYLNGLRIHPCQSCYACRKTGHQGCALDDDMQSIYPKLIQADVWVIASPVYWFCMSAQTKLFLDRCFALLPYKPSVFATKRIAVAMSYGDTDPFSSGCVNALRSFQDTIRYMGAKLAGLVYGSASEAGAIESNADLMARAERLGRRLAAGN